MYIICVSEMAAILNMATKESSGDVENLQTEFHFVVAILNLVGLFLLWQIDWNFAYEFSGRHSEL